MSGRSVPGECGGAGSGGEFAGFAAGGAGGAARGRACTPPLALRGGTAAGAAADSRDELDWLDGRRTRAASTACRLDRLSVSERLQEDKHTRHSLVGQAAMTEGGSKIHGAGSNHMRQRRQL